MPEPALFSVTFSVAAADAERVGGFLEQESLVAATWQHAEALVSLVSVYVDSMATAKALCANLPSRLGAAGLVASGFDIADLGGVEWRDAWKRFFRPRPISARIMVHPSWEPVSVPPGMHPIEIDPGLSFGTGLHGTTCACIQLIDRLSASGVCGRLLDAGCGSGILTLAAIRLGFYPVEAFDNDTQAVLDTRSNLTRNGLDAEVSAGDALAPPDGPPATVIVANILAPVLHEALPALIERLADNGFLILSGILTTQFAQMRADVEHRGLSLVETIAIDDWTSGCFRRMVAPGPGSLRSR